MSSHAIPEPLDPSFQLRLPSFEGPLDLLLHLIQKHELNILDLPIAFVTERYLEHVQLMERLNLDVAGEYLLMAATLAHIKSRMLLPSVPEPLQDESSEDEPDPRAELIRRLLEYQKYKNAAEELSARCLQGRDFFLRGMEALEASGPAPLAGIALFQLLDAFRAVLERAKHDLAFEVTADEISIQDRMTQLLDRLRKCRWTTFDDLFDDPRTVYGIVVTFLAILEMAKRRLVRIYQSEATSAIHIEAMVLDVEEGISEPQGRATTAGEGAVEPEAVHLDSDATPAQDSPPAAPFAGDGEHREHRE